MFETNPALLKINPAVARRNARLERRMIAVLAGFYGSGATLLALILALPPHHVFEVKNKLRADGAATNAYVQFLFVEHRNKSYNDTVRFGYIVDNSRGGSMWGTDQIVSPPEYNRLHVGQRLVAVYDRTFPMTVRLDLPDDPAVGPPERDPLVPGCNLQRE